MKLSVYSEIGRLRDVLVHEPGAEVDNMPPSMMSELLFDDILYGPRARLEHRRYRAVLERLGVRTWDSADLLHTALEADSAAIRGLLVKLQELEGLSLDIIHELEGLAPAELADALIHGRLARPDKLEPDGLFKLAPLPNLLFSRDPQIVLGSGVVISSMSRLARQREPLLSRHIFEYHPELSDSVVLEDFLRAGRGHTWLQNVPLTIEGGDVLVFHEGVVIVGISERTMERAVDRLVRALRATNTFETLIMVPMPRKRSVMHLDTIFTRTSRDECLAYAPLILRGRAETLSVIRIDLRDPDDWGRRRPSLLDALREVGVDLTPICCGGPASYISQTREQWTDGANSFAVRPGVVLIYHRNTATAEELGRRGYDVVSIADMAFDDDGRCLYDFDDDRKYAILVAGEELSRARGGPRCMTMPLVRDAVDPQ